MTAVKDVAICIICSLSILIFIIFARNGYSLWFRYSGVYRLENYVEGFFRATMVNKFLALIELLNLFLIISTVIRGTKPIFVLNFKVEEGVEVGGSGITRRNVCLLIL